MIGRLFGAMCMGPVFVAVPVFVNVAGALLAVAVAGLVAVALTGRGHR